MLEYSVQIQALARTGLDNKSRTHLRDFIKTGTEIARHTVHAVPRLELEMKEHLSSKNPYLGQADIWLAVAYDETGKRVGRLSLQIPHKSISRNTDNTPSKKIGHFGFIAAKNKECLTHLLHAGENFLRAQGCTVIRGPYSFSINDEVGLLSEGFHAPPRVMMNYAPAFYKDTLEDMTYRPIKELLAYDLDTGQDIPRRSKKMANMARGDTNITARPIHRKSLTKDLEIIREIFNQAWANNWGFIPLSQDDMQFMAANLKPILKTDLTRIVCVDGKPAAMIVALPDVNEALTRLGGRLWPFGWMRLLYHLKIRQMTTARVLLMGVLPEYQSTAYGSALSLFMIDELRAEISPENKAQNKTWNKRMKTVELSWILEDNTPMRRMIEAIGGQISRRYTLYEKMI